MNEAIKAKTYTIEQAAKLLGLSRNSCYDAGNRGEIPAVRVGKRLLVPIAAFDRFLENCSEPKGPYVARKAAPKKPVTKKKAATQAGLGS